MDRVRRGMLFPVRPIAPRSTLRRALFVTEELQSVLVSPEGDEAWERRIATLRADLEVFVEARTIDPKYLFLLYPTARGVWEIRSVRENPSMRVLGFFPLKDVFVATNVALREDLGGWQSRAWKQVKRHAGARWRGLFHTYRPIITADVSQVVTGAIDGRYFKGFTHS